MNVNLTDQQIQYLQTLLNTEQIELMHEYGNKSDEQIAFIKRIRTKLANS